MRILVVAAHPDDEVLGCGATIARLAREGHEAHIAILGEGGTSRAGESDPSLVRELRAQAAEAARVLGAREPLFYDLPDNRFDTRPLLEVSKIVEEVIGRVRPEVIYTHHGGDLNVDHGVAHRAVLTAARPLPGACVREIYAFEVASSTEWAFGQASSAFRPRVFTDVGATLSLKIEALKRYRREVREFPHPRSEEGIAALARWRGSSVGCPAAEAFELVRSVR
jgi:LmbE family N-acetylglucosaminyl deacetylase